jgi:hypothetical protein
MPTTTSPKYIGDLYGAAIIAHSPIVAPIVPGAQSSSIWGQSWSTTIPPKSRPITGCGSSLTRAISRGSTGFCWRRSIPVRLVQPIRSMPLWTAKAASRSSSFEVGAGADPLVLIPQCANQLRQLGIYLEGLGAFGQ